MESTSNVNSVIDLANVIDLAGLDNVLQNDKRRQRLFAVFDEKKLNEELLKVGSSKRSEENEQRVHYLKEMQKGGAWKMLAPAPALEQFDELDDAFPHFKAVVDHFRRYAALASYGSHGMEAKSILLVGAPGLGKTFFCQELARVLNTHFQNINLTMVTDSFVISGASTVWKSGKPGKIWQTLIQGRYANPVVLLDEIDKMKTGGQSDLTGPLLHLLEKNSAKQFADEALDGSPLLDASKIIWIATANSLPEHLSDALLSRLKVFNIEKPNEPQMLRLIGIIYDRVLKTNSWGKYFLNKKNKRPVSMFTKLVTLNSAREITEALELAFGRAAVAGRDYLIEADIEEFPPHG